MTEGKLDAYRRMRDFDRTSEPAGGTPSTVEDRRFVVQRHRASRLHYDLRLEIDGVLVSWAVPKGPTLDPAVKRAAIHVEDHPLDYITYEGTIPKGEYGGGDVIVWDTGTWVSHVVDAEKGLADGELHLELLGAKLRGHFMLIRTKRGGDGRQWLLFHKRDEHAVDGWDPEEHPLSVLSGRTNDDVRAGRPAPVATVPVDELAGLEDLGSAGTWSVHGRELQVTNLDKVLFPARGDAAPITKRELLAYTAQIAPVLTPYLQGRPLNLRRFPQGAQSKGFWHKQLPAHAPAWLPRWEDPETGEDDLRTYLVVDEPAALVWAANFGALEWHPWTSTTAAQREPTYALIDLDPGPKTSWEDLLALARLHRTALEHLGVTGRAKVTGSRGIQIWIPLAPGPTFAETGAWVEQLSRAIGAVVPELVSWEWSVRARGGLARLDYTQNAINKTLVAPYSPRAAPGAPVSTPIDWDELDDPTLRPDGFTFADVLARLSERGDLFAPVLHHGGRLPPLG